MAGFDTFVFDQLPPPPRRVLEVGCGREGGLVGALVEAGYDALGVDPAAPEGERFVRLTFQEAAADGLASGFDAAVAGRVLHHVRPLAESLDVLASLAPLLVVDEFAWDRIDEAAQSWYEGQYRLLRAAGAEPDGPSDLDAWRVRHWGLHPHGELLAALHERYEEVALEWVPFFHRWLGGPSSEALEAGLVAAGAIPAIGWRWAGRTR